MTDSVHTSRDEANRRVADLVEREKPDPNAKTYTSGATARKEELARIRADQSEPRKYATNDDARLDLRERLDLLQAETNAIRSRYKPVNNFTAPPEFTKADKAKLDELDKAVSALRAEVQKAGA